MLRDSGLFELRTRPQQLRISPLVFLNSRDRGPIRAAEDKCRGDVWRLGGAVQTAMHCGASAQGKAEVALELGASVRTALRGGETYPTRADDVNASAPALVLDATTQHDVSRPLRCT